MIWVNHCHVLPSKNREREAPADGTLEDWLRVSPSLASERELIIRYDAIHLVDAFRYLFGEVESLYVRGSRWRDGSGVRGETDALIVLNYKGFTAWIRDSSGNWAGDARAHFRVEGTEGVAKGTFGVWYDYPVGRADRMAFCERSRPGDWAQRKLPGRWAPDAWAWTMAKLLESIRSGKPAVHEGRDHVRTLEYIEAAYRSLDRAAPVAL